CTCRDNRDDARVDRLVVRRRQAGGGHARVEAVVGEERLDRRERRTHGGGRRALVRAVPEAEVRRDRDCREDRENDHHDEELDQGETLLAPQTLPQLVEHGAPSMGGGLRWPRTYRRRAVACPSPRTGEKTLLLRGSA